jgi:diguanylate cyclase (GGDEF)-like protein
MRMKTPEMPRNEKTRVEKLDSLGVIYSPAEERFDRITRLARQVFDVPISLISLVSAKCQWFKSAQGLPVSETSREISFCGHAILSDETLVIPDTSRDPDFADNPLVTGDPFIRFYAGRPLTFEGMKLGTLCIIDRKSRRLSPSQMDTLRSLAAWAENEFKVAVLSAAQLDLISELSETRRQTMIDPLTSVWNRRGIEELLMREMAHAQRVGDPVTLMMIDVDNFKEINDQSGHAAGDRALKEIAQRIRSSVRPHDAIGRVGGDEFIVFLGDCNRETAAVLAKRILSRVCDEDIEEGGVRVSITLSIGAVTIDRVEDINLPRTQQLADKALYEAKTAGRNRFVLQTHS